MIAQPKKESVKQIAATGGKPSDILKAKGKKPQPSGGYSKPVKTLQPKKKQKPPDPSLKGKIGRPRPEDMGTTGGNMAWNDPHDPNSGWNPDYVDVDPFTGQPRMNEDGTRPLARTREERGRSSSLQDEAMRRYREWQKSSGMNIETMDMGWDPASGLSGSSSFLGWAKQQPEYAEIVRQRQQYGEYDPTDPFKYNPIARPLSYEEVWGHPPPPVDPRQIPNINSLGPNNLPYYAALNKSGQ